MDNYCQVVKPGDTVYHLGDVAFSEESGSSIRKLPGRKYLIVGNHDHRWRKSFSQWGFSWSKDVFELRIGGGTRKGGHTLWLSHYAHRVWPKRHYGTLHLYGHSHGNLPFYPQSADVGVDAWNYYPVSLEEVAQYIKTNGENHELD